MIINNKNPKQGWKNNIKYFIWIIWIASIILCFLLRKQQITVDFFYMTDHGISISNIYAYIIYYGVVFLIFIPSVVFGKRVFCHYFCWMAPFMIIGNNIGNKLHIKRLKLDANTDKCINCHMCNKNCPMGLNVEQRASNGDMFDNECILCGECIDNCPKKAITYKF